MVITHEYKVLRLASYFRIYCEEKQLCPSCNNINLSSYGWRERMVIGLNGKKCKYMIQRLRCSICGKIHHLLPDFIVPNKNYSVEVITEIIKGNKKYVPCDDNTITRLANWFYKGISMLKAKVFITDKQAHLEKDIKFRNEELSFYIISKIIAST